MQPPSCCPRALSSSLPVALVGLAALALFALSPPAPPFSDTIELTARVAGGPLPYYNLLYLPLGWLVHRALLPLLAWSAFEALRWTSIVCAAAAAGVAARLARRAGWGPAGTLLFGLLFALTPGVWFFARTVEVHALQLLGAALATELALAARGSRTPRALALVGAGALLAAVTHATSLLLVPALVWLARRREPGRGLPLAAPASMVPLAAMALAALAGALVVRELAGSATVPPALKPLRTLVAFGELYVQRLSGEPLFGPLEVWGYFQDELVRPAGLLLAGALLGLLVPGRRRASLAALALFAPYFLVFFQSGVREGGGYFVSLHPALLWLTARTGLALRARIGAGPALAALAAAVALQGTLAWRHQRPLLEARDAREWIAEVERVAPPRSVLVTVSLPRWHAMSHSASRYEGTDVLRSFQLVPFSEAEDVARHWLSLVAGDVLAGKRTFLDADLFDDPDEPPYYPILRRVLAGFPARLEPRLDSHGRPILYEVLESGS